MKSYLNNKIYLPFLCLLTASCIKTPSTDLEYGLEVDRKLVKKSIETALGPTNSPSDIRLDETIKYSTTQLIRGRNILDTVSTTILTIVEKHDTQNQWQYNITHEYQKFNPYNPKIEYPKLVSEDHQCWNKATSKLESCEIDVTQKSMEEEKKSRTTTPYIFDLESLLYPMEEFEELPDGGDYKLITYHKLSVKKKKLLIKNPNSNSDNCDTIPNCQINATEIEFDLVDWRFSKAGVKYHLRYLISSEVPRLARFLEKCQQSSIAFPEMGTDPNNPPRFLVTTCDTIDSFIAGKTPSN